MTGTRRSRWWVDAARGAIAGGLATWLMDLVTTGLLEGQSEETTRREKEARPNGQSAIANLVDRLESVAGVSLDESRRATASQLLHYGLGVVPGALYAILRARLPFAGTGRGVPYGIAVWAVNDEYLNSRLGLAGPVAAYPAETHWRGFVGHAVLGGATDAAIDLLGG